MGTLAYYSALVTVMAVPAALLSLFALNLLSPEWRRTRPAAVRILRVGLILLVMGAVFMARGPLLRLHFGVKLPLVVGAIVLFGISSYLRAMIFKAIPATTALELADPDGGRGGELCTKGIYSRVRHPGYAAMALAVGAVALFANYAAMYAVAVFYVPLIYLAARLEERELRERFPGEYGAYCERVPRFLPRLTRSGSARRSA